MIHSSERSGATLVLGLGNPLRQDDGLGACAVEMLSERELPPEVSVKEAGMPGWGLPAWLEGWSKVILIDAAQMGLEPGVWRRFGPESVRLRAGQDPVSLHEPGLADGLALAQALDMLPEEIVFFCIEPGCTDGGRDLSPAVKSALPELVDYILCELRTKKHD
jgi:hydrogenase maturation protease